LIKTIETNAIDNELNIIDFSNGIRPEEIQENFEILKNQIQRERKNVGGPGISSGLEVEIIVNELDFKVKLSSASIITNDGNEIFIPETEVDIDRPKLIQEKEYLNANYNNQIELKHIPYASNKKTISQFADTYLQDNTGINIKYQDSTAENDNIKITSIMKNAITLSSLTRRDLEVTYNYSAKRIDTLYIDNEYNIKVVSGVTSTTPSAIMPKDFKFLIAFLEIDAYSIDSNNRMYANIIYRKDLRQVRNIYTDSTGKLWICGTPFDDLQIIHMTEPADPSENAMWYDIYSNQIKVWRATDKLVYMNSYEVTTDYSLYPEATQDYDTDMYYKVGNSQLDVYVNDVKLDETEYCELNELKLPVDKIDIERAKLSKSFRIFKKLNLRDKITYKIQNFDKHFMWVPINNLSFVNVKEVKMFGDSNDASGNYYASQKAIALGNDDQGYPYKYQYFFFHATEDMNMFFTPGKKELDIMINQIPLHFDQFEEITIFDLYDGNLPQSCLTALSDHYGYTPNFLSSLNSAYETIGIGFKLKDPLDVSYGHETNGATDLYVEACVTRRVNDSPFKRKLQRTATFVVDKEIQYSSVTDNKDVQGSINRIDDATFIVNLEESYLYDECQLEVFVNGIKLNKSQYIEATDLSDEPIVEDGVIVDTAPRSKGAKSKQFTIKKGLVYGDIVSYRITTNIYSYDHINQLLDELEYDAKTASLKVEQLYDNTLNLQNEIQNQIEEIQQTVEEVRNLTTDLDDSYMKKDDTITDSQIPAWIITNTPKSMDHINWKVVYSGQEMIDVSNHMREEDFIFCIKRSKSNLLDSFYIRDIDYRILNVTDATGNEASVLEFITKPDIYDTLYFTGMKFNTVWRNN
jgi:hypothetical protein